MISIRRFLPCLLSSDFERIAHQHDLDREFPIASGADLERRQRARQLGQPLKL